jgi:hypothetical protein
MVSLRKTVPQIARDLYTVAEAPTCEEDIKILPCGLVKKKAGISENAFLCGF